MLFIERSKAPLSPLSVWSATSFKAHWPFIKINYQRSLLAYFTGMKLLPFRRVFGCLLMETTCMKRAVLALAGLQRLVSLARQQHHRPLRGEADGFGGQDSQAD
jgi:hypothetical protein